MKLAAAFAATGLILAALPTHVAAQQDAPYVGVWDCGVGVFTFTRESYNAGEGTLGPATVEVDGNNYIFTFPDGYSIGVSSPTDTSMQWLSFESGDMFDCTRLYF
jgi:hypothetical protein